MFFYLCWFVVVGFCFVFPCLFSSSPRSASAVHRLSCVLPSLLSLPLLSPLALAALSALRPCFSCSLYLCNPLLFVLWIAGGLARHGPSGLLVLLASSLCGRLTMLLPLFFYSQISKRSTAVPLAVDSSMRRPFCYTCAWRTMSSLTPMATKSSPPSGPVTERPTLTCSSAACDGCSLRRCSPRRPKANRAGAWRR